MKITLEPSTQETEVIIRGDVSGKEVENLIKIISNCNVSNKLILYKDDEQFIVDAKEIVFMEACNNKVIVTTNDENFVSGMKLYELKGKLAVHRFVQINKSVIVNIEFVKSVQAEFSGNYTIRLKDRKEILTVSRKFFKDFKNSI